ncbi:MAG TPA: metallophosphoesterase [Polyangia bacterium]|nr:metallophosphoesterase [Polyangia bacterium]
MISESNRRDLLKLLGVGGVVFASGLAGAARSNKKRHAADDFFFLQLSDTHWGYTGVSNPNADVTLPTAIDTINSVGAGPDFIVFTGDLTHDTPDAAVRRKRMAEFKQLAARLKVPTLHFLPGEHDAAKDAGQAYQEAFGPSHYAFDHKGVHFVALDNVSDPAGAVGAAQIDWLAADLKKIPAALPVVVFTHRPLFDLFPQWEWATQDGAKVIDVLSGRKNVTVFYGHIHQEHHHVTGEITHHAARSLIFALPPPGSVPKKVPLAWDPQAPYRGLGYRSVELAPGTTPSLAEQPIAKSSTR